MARERMDFKRTEADPKILINGDENATFSQAIYVFDEVRKLDIHKVNDLVTYAIKNGYIEV